MCRVSTRRVDELVQALGLSGISKSQVSVLCAELDGEVERFRTHPLSGAVYPYVWLDATYFFSDPPSVFPFDRAEEPSQIALHAMPGPLTNKTGSHLLDETIKSGCPDDFRRERMHT